MSSSNPKLDSFSSDSMISLPVDKILCYITGKIRRNTPEENVRQRISRSLVEEYGYDKKDIDIEFPIKVFSKKPRVDIVIFNENSNHDQKNIYMMIETKREAVSINDRKEGIEQLKSYMSSCPNCHIGMWTNGIERICLQKTEIKKEITFSEIIDIPLKGKSVDEFEKLHFVELRPALELRSVFKRCHNYIFGNQGLPKDRAFHELLKIIFCKVLDENESSEVRFFVTNREVRSTTGYMKVNKRLDALFNEVKDTYPHIFDDEREKIELKPDVLSYIVSQLQQYSFLDTETDVKGEAYEEIVGSNLRGDRGEFFTPRNVCTLAVEMLISIYNDEEWKNLRYIDPACGTGGFLIAIINYVKKYYYEEEYNKWKTETTAKSRTKDRIKNFCEKSLFGIDFNPLLVRATKMNEVLHGNGSGNLFSVNSLLPPIEWPEEVRNKVKLGSYDLVFTNPPFGAKIPIIDPHVLDQYDLAHIWREKKEGVFEKTDKLQSSVPPEQLFIERCVQLVKPLGRIALVVPDSILSNPGLKYIRYWLLKKCRILASIDLPSETFQPHVGTQTSLIILERKNDDEIKYEEDTGIQRDYNIFMAIPKEIGRDRRGNIIYRRTPEGEIILQSVKKEIIKITKLGKSREYIESVEKIIADDLEYIPDLFIKWWREDHL